MSRYSYFRLMDESDLDWVYATEIDCYPFPWSKQGFVKVMDDGLGYVICDSDHQLLGYACFLTVVDEVQLLNLCVAPEYRHQRVAQNALHAFFDHFQSADFSVMQLEVRVSNPALKLYRKVGFKEDGVRKGYYPTASDQPREDAVLMSCQL